MPEKLKTEYSGILNWLIDGAKMWMKDELQPPPSILAATAAYRESEDPIGQFLKAKCVIDTAQWSKSSDIYQWHKRDCDETGVRPVSLAKLGKYLHDIQKLPRKESHGILYQVALKDRAFEEEPGECWQS